MIALREFRRASEFDPPNRAIAAKVLDLERKIRDQIEAVPSAANRAAASSGRAGGRRTAALQFQQHRPADPVSAGEPARHLQFHRRGDRHQRHLRQHVPGPRVHGQSREVTLEQALQQIVSANGLFYKVMNPKTIMIIPDNAQKRAQYEEQVIVSFPLSYVDSQELAQTINQVIRPVGQALAPAVTANKSTNTVTIRATTAMMAIIERMIETLDKPRAEIVVDVQILEVSRTRAQAVRPRSRNLRDQRGVLA